jgi:DNA-binding NtrC family response regulator
MDTECRMLVADDSPVTRQLFRDVVSRAQMPITLVEACNGNECKRLLLKGRKHLAFINARMPGISGIRAIIAARRAGIKTFITLMSSRPNDELFEVARQLRVYEFLIKPFTSAEIEAVIRKYNHVVAPMRALIVDDSDTAVLTVKGAVDKSVFRIGIEQATDTSVAVALCRSELFEIVFLNCDLTKRGGATTIERLKRYNPSVKVVVMTSDRSSDQGNAAARLGATDVLQQPLSTEQVDEVLHRLYGLPVPANHASAPESRAGASSLVA